MNMRELHALCVEFAQENEIANTISNPLWGKMKTASCLWKIPLRRLVEVSQRYDGSISSSAARLFIAAWCVFSPIRAGARLFDTVSQCNRDAFRSLSCPAPRRSRALISGARTPWMLAVGADA